RIGRQFPQYQDQMVPIFQEALSHSRTKESVRFGAIVGLGKLCQSNSRLRSNFSKVFIPLCYHALTRMRWAAIKALGSMCFSQGHAEPDEELEQLTYELACD